MSLAIALLLSITLTFIYMSGCFVFALTKHDTTIADTAWGLGFALVASASFLSSWQPSLRGVIVTIMVLIWGSRLAWHLSWRAHHRARTQPYSFHKKTWDYHQIIKNFFSVFMLRGLLILCILIPNILINSSLRLPLTYLDTLGVAIWLLGFSFEVISDEQLRRFKRKAQNQGNIMMTGLWRYTRHPNYFGEMAMWWGIYLLALNVPYGWLSIIGPVIITYRLLKISGVPVIEARYRHRVAYRLYQQQTNAIIPWLPRQQ